MSDARPFAHLHCHTHYSLLDGANRIPELVQTVKALGMNACAITDHGNLYGALEFYQTCQAHDVNPVLGYEAYIAPASRQERSSSRLKEAAFHLTLLAMNGRGFQNLIKLASRAYLEGFYYKPRIDKELLEQFHEGIVCLSGCASGELSRILLAENFDAAQSVAQWYADLFGDRFYMEIQDAGVEIQQSCAEATVDLANRMGLPLVATNDAHYLCQTDAELHDVLLCVNTKSFRSEANRMKIDTDQLFIRSPQQMYDAFPSQAEAVARSQEIADRVDIDLDLTKRHFPAFTPPAGKSDAQYLRELCEEGLKWRYGENPDAKYRERLEYELGIIEEMGYPSYFLIVWDFARFARENHIPCTARGSACGAIVAYLLGISDVCPIQYDLLFERFLDPSRSEAPDIDIDFCRDRRQWVIDYVKEKYGEQNVAQVGTFGTLKAKAAVRDVARALSLPLKRADEIAKMVPDTLNIKLADALKQSPDLQDEYNRDPQVKELIDCAMGLEGLAKSAGTHAAGVVIADRPLDDYVPLQKITGKDDILTQWTDVEKAGLLKMDFLGLRNLTILDKAVQNVRQTHPDFDMRPIDFPLDDEATFALLQRGETKGIFQLESGGMRDLLTKMKPDTFQDIIATSALYRPGPLEGGMVLDYVNVKHGRQEPAKVHPVVDEILEETYGVMVYQEQVMRILNRLGGIELAQSYQCIKAISKKKLPIIAQYREQFIEGAQKNNMSREQAESLFGLIEKFAGYGFNKSHSTAYGAIAYQTAYLKAHYPHEFMAALLSCGMESSDRIAEHTDDCRRMGIKVLPPDVNTSNVEFSVVDESRGQESEVGGQRSASLSRDSFEERSGAGQGSGARGQGSAPSDNGQSPRATPRGSDAPTAGRMLSFGLGAIKGVGETPMQALVDERTKNGFFKDIFDLCERVDPRHLTKGVLEILIKAGALDEFGPNRAQHMLVVDRAIQAAAAVHRDRAAGQMSLFGTPEPAVSETGSDRAEHASLPPADDWTHALKLAGEKEVFGFYLTSHPLSEFAEELAGLATHTTVDLRGLDDGKDVIVGGMVSSIKRSQTKTPSRSGNSRYLNFDLEDEQGAVRCILWPDDFALHGEKIVADAICVLEGRVDRRGREPNLIVNKVHTLDEAERKFTRQVAIKFRRGFHTEEDMRRVRDILTRHPGGTPLAVVLETWEEPGDADRTPSDTGGPPASSADPPSRDTVRLDAEHAAPPPPTRGTRLRAVLTTATHVCANAALKSDLTTVLGKDGFRYVRQPVNG